MGSRENILRNILEANLKKVSLPELEKYRSGASGDVNKFIEVITGIGGQIVKTKDLSFVRTYVLQHYSGARRIIATVAELPWKLPNSHLEPHTFEDVDLAILTAHFAVAENGAMWITDNLMGDRTIPFITQHLALIVNERDIVPTLNEAYGRIDSSQYEFGTFIAGPSKTADIEQSLVLGAHGPKSLTVFLIE